MRQTTGKSLYKLLSSAFKEERKEERERESGRGKKVAFMHFCSLFNSRERKRRGRGEGGGGREGENEGGRAVGRGREEIEWYLFTKIFDSTLVWVFVAVGIATSGPLPLRNRCSSLAWLWTQAVRWCVLGHTTPSRSTSGPCRQDGC